MNLGANQRLFRRQFLQAGTLALAAGAMPARSAHGFVPGSDVGKTAFGRAKSCILVYLLGGPPQIDMWDMKPEAPAEISGPFRSIASPVAGMRFCEHLPRLAARAKELAILRSVTFPNNDHPAMIYHTLTGRESRVPLGANTVLPPSRSDDPHLGAVISKFKHRDPRVPGYVAIPEVRVRMMPLSVSGGGRAGLLGAAYDPIAINDDPREPLRGFKLPEGLSTARFESRQALLAVLDGLRRAWRCRPSIKPIANRRRGWSVRRPPVACSRSTKSRPRFATAMAGIASAKACCWLAGWSSGACRLSACTSTT